MSTNKTENLQLHSWVRSDPFKMDEFNDNFDKLDQAVGENKDAINAKAEQTALAAEIATREALAATVPKFHCGTYDGDGKQNRKIPLSFSPKMVYVTDSAGQTYYQSGNQFYVRGGPALMDVPLTFGGGNIVEVVEGGFQVGNISNYYSCNASGSTYRYFAIG